MWNLNGSFGGPVACLDIPSLLKSDHITSISNYHLTLAKACQDILNIPAHERLISARYYAFSISTQSYLFCCCGRHRCFLALVRSHPPGQASSTVLSVAASVKRRVQEKIGANACSSRLVPPGHKMRPSSCPTVLLMPINISFLNLPLF